MRGSIYREIWWSFLKIGATAFGGPYPQMAVMEREFVERRSWMDRPTFHRGVALAQMLPGPIGPQAAIHTGWVRGGWRGGVLAGLAFVLPAFLMVLGLSMAYMRYGWIPSLERFFAGIKPVLLVLLFDAGRRLLGDDRRGWVWGLAGIAAAGALLRTEPVFLLIGCALVSAVMQRGGGGLYAAAPSLFALAPGTVPLAAAAAGGMAVATGPVWLPLVGVFLKAGAFIYGGGWTIVPLLEHEVVGTYQWMTREVFLDGMAIGQMTPGPVVITATFIGYVVKGAGGAVAATAALFLPSFAMMLAAAPASERLSAHPGVRAALPGVLAGSAGILLGELVHLFGAAVPAPWTPIPGGGWAPASRGLWALALLAGSALAILWKRWDATRVLLACGAVGWAVFR